MPRYRSGLSEEDEGEIIIALADGHRRILGTGEGGSFVWKELRGAEHIFFVQVSKSVNLSLCARRRNGAYQYDLWQARLHVGFREAQIHSPYMPLCAHAVRLVVDAYLSQGRHTWVPLESR